MSISALEPIVATLVADGVFGNVCYLGLETDVTVKGTQFLSDLTFINLKVDGPKGKEVMPLVIKLPRNNAEESWNRYAMFHNEITMYYEILSYFGVETNFYPQLFYGLATNGVEPEKDLLVLENLKYKNFLLSKTILFLDIDHISIAIKKIAEFHKESFIQMAKKFKVIDSPPAFHHEFEVINAACIERGVKPIIKKNASVDLLTEFLNLLKHPIKMKDFISSPEEPYVVICHADFCNNNILYKFDENEKPIDCVFFDFQFSNYGSPAIDISFFLYLHTTAELREKYWDKILKLYWDTLRKRVPNQIS
nr:uncharacterized protein LOC112210431 [Halyomorpha halys]